MPDILHYAHENALAELCNALLFFQMLIKHFTTKFIISQELTDNSDVPFSEQNPYTKIGKPPS